MGERDSADAAHELEERVTRPVAGPLHADLADHDLAEHVVSLRDRR
jgi:hypothetical protein